MNGIVGTAGHIDHGKTALIGALTGEDTDRLPEERERGISIDLGFSHLELDDVRLGIVDVPGHEDFIRNMVAGATGIDVLLLVVAADEGVMPQTREHVAIAQLLGVRQAVVALTKADRVEPEWLPLVREEVAELLTDSPLSAAPVIATSTVTGEGLDELKTALRSAFTAPRGRADDLFRMPVDRVFTVRGTGTVVTGTVWSGSLSIDEEVRLLPAGPGARVRTLQVHGAEAETVTAGQRAALGLAGVDRDEARRGMAVVAGPGWAGSSMLTVRLRVLPGPGWSIEDRQRVRVHLGTAEVMARAVPLGGETLAPGDEGWVQLRLEAPVVARTGDRFVVRSYSPMTTIAGGVVAEPLPPKRTRVSEAATGLLGGLLEGGSTALNAALRLAGGAGLRTDALPIHAGIPAASREGSLGEVGALVVGGLAFPADAGRLVEDRLLAAVEEHHAVNPLQPGIDPELLRQAVGEGAPALVDDRLSALLAGERLRTVRGRVALPGHEPEPTPAQRAVLDRIRQRLRDAGSAPPRLDELEADVGAGADLVDLMELLEADGAVVRIEHDLFIDRDALDAIVGRVTTGLGGRTAVRPADFRDLLGISRRHLMPLLGYLDRTGVTARSGEGRTVSAS